MRAGRLAGLKVWSLLLQVLVVGGDGHQLVLVSWVQIIPRFRVIGLVPGDVGSFGQAGEVDEGSAHPQTDEEELGDESGMLLSMFYCCPEYHVWGGMKKKTKKEKISELSLKYQSQCLRPSLSTSAGFVPPRTHRI